MDGRGDRGESVAIIGMACRFPGARDPAEFHNFALAGRDMFQPVAALPGLGEVAGTCRAGRIIASSVPGLGEQVREEFGFPARGLFSRSAHVSSLHAVEAAAGALQTGQLDLAVAGGRCAH
jgi:hypothetical protein